MFYIPSSAASSPTRSFLDYQPAPSGTQPLPSGEPSQTLLLAGMCPQPASLGPRFSPRLLRGKISHNISSLINIFESSNPTAHMATHATRFPSYQSMLPQVPRASLDRLDGISVVRRRGTSNLRSSSSANTLGKGTCIADRYSSSSDQIVLETTTFMRGWTANKKVDARGGMRTETTHNMNDETLRGSERRPPPIALNRGSRSSVSPSDCIGSRRERLSSAVREKVRLFDTGNKTIVKPSMASLDPVKASPGSFASYTQPPSAFSASNSEVTLTPTRSISLVTPTRAPSSHPPGNISAECIPRSCEPLFVNNATPYSMTPSSPMKYCRSAERNKITQMSPEQATTAMELMTPRGTPVRYKLIPTVQHSPSHLPKSRSLRGSWRKIVGDPFTVNAESNRGSISSYRGIPAQVQEQDSSALPHRKLFARIGLQSDVFKQPSEKRQRLKTQKKKSSKVASLRRFFDKASSSKPITVADNGQEALRTPLHRANTIKKTDRSLVLTNGASAVSLAPSRFSSTVEFVAHTEPYGSVEYPSALVSPLQAVQPELSPYRSPRAKGRAIEDKVKLFEPQENTADVKISHRDRKPLAPSTNKGSRRRKRFSRGTLHKQADGENESITGRSTLRSDEVESIVNDFQSTEARLRNGKRRVLFEKWRAIEKSMHHGSTRVKGDNGSMNEGTALQAAQQDGMVIKEAQCGLKHPKPLRIVEMKRMILLCSDKVGGGAERDKVTQLRKLWHSYLRYSPTFEQR